MQVTNDFFSATGSPSSLPNANHTFAQPQDINFFKAQLNPAARPSDSSVPTIAPSMLSAQSNHLIDLRKQVTKGLQVISRSNDPNKMRGFASQLSEAQLQTQLAVKVVSKTTQFVEKMINMQ